MYLKRIRASVAAGRRGRQFFPVPPGQPFCLQCVDGPNHQGVHRADEQFAKQEKVPIVPFEEGQRKDDVAAEYRKKFAAPEGVLFIGKAQEKTPVFRTERRRNEQTGATYPRPNRISRLFDWRRRV